VERIISGLDIISLLIIAAIFLMFAFRWKNPSLHSGVKFFFIGLLFLILLFTSCNILEWAGINHTFDAYGDYIGMLIPMMWGFLFYAMLQELTEDELRSRDARFRELFNGAPVGYHELDTKGRIVRINRTELQMLDYTFKEMIGHHIWDFSAQPEISRQAVMDKLRGNIMPGRSFERVYLHKNGMRIPVLIEDKLLTDERGKITGIRSTIQNITDYKRAVRKLEESEELNRALFEYNPIETIVVNTEGMIIDFNLARKMSANRPPKKGEIMYKDYAGKHEIDMHSELMKCIRSRKTKTFPAQKYQGKILTITIAPFPKGAIVTSQDITERKFVEEALKASEERYRELWNNAPVAYHTLDTKGIITSVNRTEAKMLGYKPGEMLGKPIFDFILPNQRKEAHKRFSEKMSGKHIPEAKDRIYITKAGKKIHVTIEDIMEHDENGKIIGVRTTMIDITDRKKAEEEREQSFKQLQKVFEEMITALVSAVEIRDLYTAGHQKRVTELASAIAEEMGLPRGQIDAIKMAGLVHDIGKIAIPTEILSKPSTLSDVEMDLVKTHSQVGYEILKPVEFPWPIAQIVLQHHERINGSGYPKGLKGNDILLEARVLSIADVVEAIATYRPYHETFGIDIALEEILKNKGELYDPKVVDVCVKLFKEKKFKFKN
jgi:PAS domain S-box-containing protein/putative nucleotidyltransferase with HDIG domain